MTKTCLPLIIAGIFASACVPKMAVAPAEPAPPEPVVSAEASEPEANETEYLGIGISADRKDRKVFSGSGEMVDLYYVSLKLNPTIYAETLTKEESTAFSRWVKNKFSVNARHVGINIDLSVNGINFPTQPIFVYEYDSSTGLWKSDLNKSIQTPWVSVRADTTIDFATHYTWSQTQQNRIAKEVSSAVLSIAGLSTGTWLVSTATRGYLEKTSNQADRIMDSILTSELTASIEDRLRPAQDQLSSFKYNFTGADGQPVGSVEFEIILKPSLVSARGVQTLNPRLEALPRFYPGASLFSELKIVGEEARSLESAMNDDSLLSTLFRPNSSFGACSAASDRLMTYYGLNRPDRLLVLHGTAIRREASFDQYSRCFGVQAMKELEAMKLTPPPRPGVKFVDLDTYDETLKSNRDMAFLAAAFKTQGSISNFDKEYKRLLAKDVFVKIDEDITDPAGKFALLRAALPTTPFLSRTDALQRFFELGIATVCCYGNLRTETGEEIKPGEYALLRLKDDPAVYAVEFHQAAPGAPISYIRVRKPEGLGVSPEQLNIAGR